MNGPLRVLCLLGLVAVTIGARLTVPPPFAGVRPALGSASPWCLLGWLGPGLYPWVLGCMVDRFFGRVSGKSARRRVVVPLVVALAVSAIGGSLLGMQLNRQAASVGVTDCPTVAAVVAWQVAGLLAAIALAELVTRLRFGDGVTLLWGLDLLVMIALAGTPAAQAGLLLTLIALTGGALALRRTHVLHLSRGDATTALRVPVLAGLLPPLTAWFLSAVSGQVAALFFRGAPPVVIAVITVTVFALTGVFFTFFYVALSWSPIAIERRKLSYEGGEPGKTSTEAFERDLNARTLRTGVVLTVVTGVPLALDRLLGLPTATLGFATLLGAAALLDLRAGWSALRMRDPIPISPPTGLVQALNLRDRLQAAGVEAFVPGLFAWVLFWDLGPVSFGSVWVPSAALETAREVAAAFESEWSEVDVIAPPPVSRAAE